MKRLITTENGGMPIVLDDIRWLDDEYRNAWYAFISAFGATALTSFKLSGCVVTVNDTTYTTTAGYICLEGEILQVDAHSITVSETFTAKWVVEETYDIAGNKQFFDESNHDTYLIRKGKLQQCGYTPHNYMSCDAPYLKDVILGWTPASPTEENWHYVGSGNPEPEFLNSWANTGGSLAHLRFKKDVNGWVHIEGSVSSGVVGTGTPIFTLPTGYLPENGSIIIAVVMGDYSGGTIGISSSTGNVCVNNSSGNNSVSLAGIIFKAGN